MANRISSSFSSPVSLGNTGRQIEMRCSFKIKRGISGRSESRERKIIRLGHRSASEYSVDSLSSGFSSLALLGDTSSSDLSSVSQVERRRGVKRRNEKSVRSESVERKRRRLDLQSDSLIDSLTCLYIITPPAACGETPMKVSSREEEQPGLSHLNNIEVTSGESPVKGSSKDEEQSGLSHLNNSEVISGESPVKGSSKDEEEPEPSHLNNSEVISGESPMKGPSKDEEQPGLSHLNDTEVPSGESPMKGSSKDEEQPGLSHLNNSEVISGESPMKGSSKDEEEPEPSHLNNSEVISGESPMKGPSKDEEQPGLSHSNNTEVISGESQVKGSRNIEDLSGLSHLNNIDVRPGRSPMKECIIDDEQPGSSRPVKLDQGVKRKRDNYRRTMCSERKNIKLEPDFYPPGPRGEASRSDPSADGQTGKRR